MLSESVGKKILGSIDEWDWGGGGAGAVGGRSKMEWVCVYTQLIHFVVQQKLTQYCKVFILQYGKKYI